MTEQLRQGSRRIVVTGAGGWLGLATLEMLFDALGADAFHQSVVCLGSAARTLHLRAGRAIEQHPLAAIEALPPMPSWLLHFAFLTKDRALDMEEAAYREANEAICARVLGALDAIGVEAVLLASSGAASRADDPRASPAMRLYGAMKRDDEARFADWATHSGGAVAIARIYALTGPYINKHQAYAFASFLLNALAGKPIQVRAPHRVVRAYVSIREVIELGFALLAAMDPGDIVRFDTGGEPMELGDVAAAVAAHVPGALVDRAPIGEGPADIYYGDIEAYSRLLSTHAISSASISEQIQDTMAYLQTLTGNEA